MVRIEAPPSANKIWRSRRDRKKPHKSRPYTRWMNTAVQVMKGAADNDELPRLGRQISAVRLRARIDHTRDLDNLLKPVTDALSEAGIIEDDRWISHIHATRVMEPISDRALRFTGSACPATLPEGWIQVDVAPFFFRACSMCEGKEPRKPCRQCGRYVPRPARKR